MIQNRKPSLFDADLYESRPAPRPFDRMQGLMGSWERLLPEQVSARIQLALDQATHYPTRSGIVTSNYGSRVLDKGKEFHSGLDFRNGEGDPVFAPKDGVVYDFGFDPRSGDRIFLRHPDGGMTGYGHTAPRDGLKRGMP